MTEPLKTGQEYKLTLDMVSANEKAEMELQKKLMLQYDDEVANLKGLEKALRVSAYANVFGRLWQMLTKHAYVVKENLHAAGIEVSIDEDVPLEKMQDVMSIKWKPHVDPELLVKKAPMPDVEAQETRVPMAVNDDMEGTDAYEVNEDPQNDEM